MDHISEACEVTKRDFGTPEAETPIRELLVLQGDISYTTKNIRRWMAPHNMPTMALLHTFNKLGFVTGAGMVTVSQEMVRGFLGNGGNGRWRK